MEDAPERSSVIDNLRSATFPGCCIFDRGFPKKLSGIFPRLRNSVPSSGILILVLRKSVKMALQRHFSMPSTVCRIASTPFLLNDYLSKLKTKGVFQKQNMSKLDIKRVLPAAEPALEYTAPRQFLISIQ
jgi:hypothetical protein